MIAGSSCSCFAVSFQLSPGALNTTCSVQLFGAQVGVVGGIRVNTCSCATQRVILSTRDTELQAIFESGADSAAFL